MRLVAVPTSPYAARVLIQACEKGVSLDVAYPEPGVTIAQHAALNPFGKVPVLETESGWIIESAAIMEYLEDLFPFPSLRPADAFPLARMRSFILATDHYLFPVILQFRGLLKDPGQDPGKLAEVLASLDRVLGSLLRMIEDRWETPAEESKRDANYVSGEKFTLADCALVPAFFYLELFLDRLGQTSVFTGRPRLQAWWETVSQRASVKRVTGDLERAIAALPK